MEVKSDGFEDTLSTSTQKSSFLKSSSVFSSENQLKLRNIGKKFSKTSRFVVSSKVWQHTIPTRDCDVLMTFPKQADDQTLMWLLARLRNRTPELQVHVRHHSSTGVYGFYLTADYKRLLQGAEDLSIRKPVRKEYGGGMKEFVVEDQQYFDGVDDCSSFLSSQERQSIVKHMLYNLRANDGDNVEGIALLEGQAIVPILVSKGVIEHVLPLHNTDDLGYLRKFWVQAVCKCQPLDKICEYFGVKIAMYFAYLGHYTQALTLPAFLGLILWLISGQNQYREDILFVVFAIFNVIWSTLYLEHWKRRSAEFAYCWGTLDKEDELLVEPRPLFTGNLVKSPITGRLGPVYPDWKRNVFRYFVTLPVISVCLAVIFVVMWSIFQLQDWVNMKIKEEEFPTFAKFLPKILLAVCIGVMDDIYKKIAFWLNDKENYRLEEQYENHLIIKLVLFQFVNSFLSLFYIAFYLQDWNRLQDQLAALLITRQVIGNVKEALVPFILEKFKLFKIGYKMASAMSPNTLDSSIKKMESAGKQQHGKEDEDCSSSSTEKNGASPPPATVEGETVTEGDKSEEGAAATEEDKGERRGSQQSITTPSLTQAEVEAAQKAYEDTFDDYLEMFIQFGYVTLFSSAFPIAAMCALLNNVIEIRSDAFKLVCTLQRPFGQRVESIGTWQDALEVMSVIAVIVNCALIGMSDLAQRWFPDISVAERVVFIVIMEHIVLIIKFAVAYAIPDIPNWVAEEKARLEFLRRDALKKMERGYSSSSPTSPAVDNGDLLLASLIEDQDSDELPDMANEPIIVASNNQSTGLTRESLPPNEDRNYGDSFYNNRFHGNDEDVDVPPDNVTLTNLDSMLEHHRTRVNKSYTRSISLKYSKSEF